MSRPYNPENDLNELFYDVHRKEIFEDGKLFADARAKMNVKIILKNYKLEKDKPNFDLKLFVNEYFEIPSINDEVSSIEEEKTIEQHLSNLWQQLYRKGDKKKERNSKLPLPHPYIVPGGRFNEIYYWDSYFTMLGLKVSGQIEIIENMVKNFQYMITEFGHIPNGNRSYFLSRSQPPFYSLMVKMLIEIKGKEVIKEYLPSLIIEYNYWMNGTSELSDSTVVTNRISKVKKSFLLNRYYDEKDTPREEMYGDDWALINFSENKSLTLFRNLRAACESGWDFSSRWMTHSDDLNSIETTQILPVDLNCLIWHLEKLISECYNYLGKDELSLNYGICAVNRKKAINELFWNEKKRFFSDYHLTNQEVTDRISLAGLFPLFFGICSQKRADLVAENVNNIFLKDGGVVTTPIESGQQWDSPNGWAPLQWITVQGLLKYGHKKLAQEIASRWTSLNKSVYQRTGKMLEKYNVIDTSLKGGGGEYPVQDGFGWTNGVYLALTNS